MTRHPMEVILQLLLVICLTAVVEAAPASEVGTRFQDNRLYEGDKCGLPGMRTGICKKAAVCPEGIRANGARCEFSGNDPVVCCPAISSKPDGTGNRITPRPAQQECDRLMTSANSLTDHLSGHRYEARQGEFPFIARINYGDGAKEPISVVLGIVQADDSEKDEYRIRNKTIYAGFKKRKHDIALLELVEDVKFNRDVSPICLNTDMLETDPSVNLTVMGWGLDGSNQNTDRLWKATVNEIRLGQCMQSYQQVLNINLHENHLCALGEKWNDEFTDACQGDSGGPLVRSVGTKFYLVGVVSTGATCGSVVPGLYTRVSAYLDWIEQHVWGNSY